MLQARKKRVAILTALALASGSAQARMRTDHTSKADNILWTFDDVAVGKLPAGWKADATNRKGPLPTWQVIKDENAPSGDHVLAMTKPSHTHNGILDTVWENTVSLFDGDLFNLCWTNTVSFLDGEITVRFKALKGEEDQGGGVMWRVQDNENYYIARFNPLEDNFRLYSVRDGRRKTLASATIALSAGQWHSLRIVQHGARFEGYLDGKKLLEGRDDLFANAGGVGLWTKSDAVTSFDDFTVKPLKQ